MASSQVARCERRRTACCIALFFAAIAVLWVALPPNDSVRAQQADTDGSRDKPVDQNENDGSARCYLRLRKNAYQEILVSRSEEEDRLRVAILVVCWDQERIERLKVVLNNPWDREAIDYLYGLVVTWGDEENEKGVANPVSEGEFKRILRLLAYLGGRPQDEPISAYVVEKFNSLYEILGTNKLNWSKLRLGRLSNYLTLAIEEFGASNLITPAFWQWFEAGDPMAISVLKAISDKDALDKLNSYDKYTLWPSSSEGDRATWVGWLKGAIEILEVAVCWPRLQETPRPLSRVGLASEIRRLFYESYFVPDFKSKPATERGAYRLRVGERKVDEWLEKRLAEVKVAIEEERRKEAGEERRKAESQKNEEGAK